jgi:hypothetical protein
MASVRVAQIDALPIAVVGAATAIAPNGFALPEKIASIEKFRER